ncbi:MAG TPA: efflux transporter outer membrane subunit [Caulobacteraceae bacterium]|jgi:NodT family efflux transporter outer membrane factor (OMF) lipoprotein
MMSLTRSCTIALLLTGVAGCLVGPNYRRPSTPTPPAYKEAEGWSPAQPSDAADRADWWTVFGDPTLNDLEARVQVSNQTLAAAEAAYRQAHALVAQDQAALWPTVTADGSATVSGGGSNSAGSGASGGANGTPGAGGATRTLYRASLGATWAPDIWGAVRRNIRSAKASAQASAALVANARLSAQTELAADYFSLRELDEEKRDLDGTIVAYGKTLTITQNKYAAGNLSRSDVLTARSQLESAQAGDTDLIQQRARMEHAIAILAGQAPASLTLPPGPWTLRPPLIPAAVPSMLLQRRPDIANAERTAAAQSEQIGVAVAAFYPNVTLSGDGGFSAPNLGQLFNLSNSFWSLGAQVAETIFQGGARTAKVRQARAAYDQAVANYRQTVLTAFGQVEDNLAAQRVYITEEAQLQRAFADADAGVTIARNEYAAGTVDFTTVDAAQITALDAQRALVQMQANRLTTAVSLIEALGGGWTTASLPKG